MKSLLVEEAFLYPYKTHSMHIDLRSKRALVGGSSRGIGRAIAEQLAESGASVCVMARSEDKLKALVNQLPTDQGQKHHYLAIDYHQQADYQKKIKEYLSSNPVDILVNNTQGPPGGGALEQDLEAYQSAFDLLFKSVVFTTQEVLPHMQKQGWGRIINVASVSVQEPLNYLALSNSIRAAVVTWGKTLATDVAAQGITVNSVLTGYFDTDRIAQLNAQKAEKMGVDPAEVRKAMENQVPMKRIGDPAEYGHLVAFLASDKASYLTGTKIPLDGGLLKSL